MTDNLPELDGGQMANLLTVMDTSHVALWRPKLRVGNRTAGVKRRLLYFAERSSGKSKKEYIQVAEVCGFARRSLKKSMLATSTRHRPAMQTRLTSVHNARKQLTVWRRRGGGSRESGFSGG